MSDFSLQPQPLLGHWVPGLVVTALALFWVRDEQGTLLVQSVMSYQSTTIAILALAIISYGVGELLDSMRDLLEDLVDWDAHKHIGWKWLAKKCADFGVNELRWDFLVLAEDRHIHNFEVWYFTYYLLDGNLALGLLLLTLLPWWRILGTYSVVANGSLRWTLIAAAVIFLLNAGRLRCQMREHMRELTPQKKV